MASASGALEDILGYSKGEMGSDEKSWLNRVHPDDLHAVRVEFDRALLEDRIYDLGYRFQHKNGQYLWVHDRGRMTVGPEGELLTVIGVLKNITDRKRAEEEKKKLQDQLQQAQKMESMATLAGGIAHRFNNALSVIMGSMDLLVMNSPDDKNIRKYYGPIKEYVNRLSRLTNRLLAYARGGKSRTETLSLSQLVKDMLPMIKQTMNPLVYVDTDLPPCH